MYDVITLGSATVDVFARTKSKLIKILDDKGETDLLAFTTGSKLLIDKLVYTIGGGGTNSAVAFAKLGVKTAFLGKTGKGYNGKLIHDSLIKNKVDICLMKSNSEHTGFSIILDNLEKDRVILAHKGVNDSLAPHEINLNVLKTKWIYSSSLIGKAYKSLIKISNHAKTKNIKLAFNPSSYIAEKGISHLRPVMKNTTVLLFNKCEAMTLTKEDKLSNMFSCLHGHGPKIVVITDGKNGVHVSDGNFIYSIEARKVRKVVDTTGAGDAFAASFISGLIRKNDIEFALRLGIENSTSVIKQIGAKNGLLTWNSAKKFVQKNRRIRKIKLKG